MPPKVKMIDKSGSSASIFCNREEALVIKTKPPERKKISANDKMRVEQ